MKCIVYILLILLVLLIPDTKPQNENNKDNLTTSNETINNFGQDIPFFIMDSPFRISPELFLTKINPLAIDDSATIQLRTKLAIMNGSLPFNNGNDKPIDFLSPYYLIYKENENVSFFNKVLGLAQIGAAGYLAYKHIKKYGLFQ